MDVIAECIDDPTFKKIHRLWKLYHLNDMHADCEHQRKDTEFQKKLNETIVVYKWLHLNENIRKEKEDTMKYIKNELSKEGIVELSERQKFLYNLEDCEYNHIGEYDATLYYHEKKDVSDKKLRDIFTKDSEKGMLLSVCPICGYKYGSSWLYEPISKDDEDIIYRLLGADEKEEKQK